jgi:hypothetical protein
MAKSPAGFGQGSPGNYNVLIDDFILKVPMLNIVHFRKPDSSLARPAE